MFNPGRENLLIILASSLLVLQTFYLIPPKPSTSYRILILGDVVSYGENSWPKYLEEKFNRMGKVKVEVINLAAPNADSATMLKRLRESFDYYSPNLVISMLGATEGDRPEHFENFPMNQSNQTEFFEVNNQKVQQAVHLLNYDTKPISEKAQEIEKLLRSALAINPNNIRSYIELGHLYVITERYEEAEFVLKKAIEIEPTYIWAYHPLATLYNSSGRYKEAEKIYKKLIELEPEAYRAYFGLINALQEQGKMTEAEEVESQATFSNPLFVSNYRQIKDFVKQRGLRLVAAQYTLRSAEPLKEILEYDKDVIFVSNEENFKKELEKSPYEELFSDRFAGDFGHTTDKSNYLIAERVAEVVNEEIFK